MFTSNTALEVMMRWLPGATVGNRAYLAKKLELIKPVLREDGRGSELWDAWITREMMVAKIQSIDPGFVV